jgi:hypothetical protein
MCVRDVWWICTKFSKKKVFYPLSAMKMEKFLTENVFISPLNRYTLILYEYSLTFIQSVHVCSL